MKMNKLQINNWSVHGFMLKKKNGFQWVVSYNTSCSLYQEIWYFIKQKIYHNEW